MPRVGLRRVRADSLGAAALAFAEKHAGNSAFGTL
jgi:hypothetical protein